jgi:hypothetical protein
MGPVTKDEFLENKINLVKKWAVNGDFGRNVRGVRDWSDLILHVIVLELCPKNLIYVPYPEFHDNEKKPLPIIWHGGFFNLSKKTFFRKFSFEFVVGKNLEKPLVAEDLLNLIRRYEGTSMVFLGFSCYETGNEINKILSENNYLNKFIWPIYVMSFLNEPDEKLKVKINTRWSKICHICRSHEEVLENEIMNIHVTNKYSSANCNVQNIILSIDNPILVSNRDLAYRKGFLE